MKSATEAYRTRVLDAAAVKRSEKEREVRSSGLLDRADGLWAVMTDSGYAFCVVVVLHLLLLVMDSLPVLAKLMGGVTRYDRLLDRHLTGAERMHDAHRRALEERHREAEEADLVVLRARNTEVREAAEHELAKARALREAERRALIQDLTKRFMAE